MRPAWSPPSYKKSVKREGRIRNQEAVVKLANRGGSRSDSVTGTSDFQAETMPSVTRSYHDALIANDNARASIVSIRQLPVYSHPRP